MKMLYVLVAFFCLAQYREFMVSGATIKCQECASLELKTLWQITGLPKQPVVTDDKFYNSGCDQKTTETVDCDSACITIVIDSPAETIEAKPDKLVVRGCHSKFTGFVAEELKGNEQCEYDTAFKTTKADGTAVEIYAAALYCSTGSECNGRPVAEILTTCKDAPVGKVKQCYDCYGDDNCFENKATCGKKYCYKSEIDLGNGLRKTHKTCTGYNPLGLVSRCSTVNQQLFVPVRSTFPMTAYHCYCEDEELCNAALSNTRIGLAGGLITMLLAYLLQ